VVVIRPFNTFGPYQSPRAIIGEMIINCLRGRTIVSTKGVQTREFNYVSNIVDAFILAVRVEKAVGQIINVGAGEEIRIKDLILLIHKLTGSRSKLQIGKLKYRPTEIWRMKTDNTKAMKILGWKPRYSFREGLEITVEWYRKFLEVYGDKKSGLSRLARWDETKGR
jgi:nucleoside-diphosphate-sugar epimerase